MYLLPAPIHEGAACCTKSFRLQEVLKFLSRKNQNEKIEQIHVDDHDTLNKVLTRFVGLVKASPYQLVWILYITQGSKFS